MVACMLATSDHLLLASWLSICKTAQDCCIPVSNAESACCKLQTLTEQLLQTEVCMPLITQVLLQHCLPWLGWCRHTLLPQACRS